MQIKAADNKRVDFAALEVLLNRPDVVGSRRREIQYEIRNIRAGKNSEAQSAYEIEFLFGTDLNVMTIHDLRIECDARVAQIDHLIIDRLLDIWVCESKSFKDVAIDDRGEWRAYYDEEEFGIASPIEQNRKHVAVLNDVFAKGLVSVPMRRGVPLKPQMRSLILFPNGARISRPRRSAAYRVPGLDAVIKVEQLHTTITRAIAKKRDSASPTFVGPEIIEKLASQLVALHSPSMTDWAARFGLHSEPWAQVPAIPLGPPSKGKPPRAASVRPNARRQTRAVCEACGTRVSEAVVTYCRANASLFGGRIYCIACQDEVRRRR